MAHDLYNHVSLNGKPKSIRILQLSTAQGRPLEGHLKEVSLSSNPTYYALSYTWGGPSSPAQQILCHSSSSSNLGSAYIEITTNCYDALTQLRRDLAPRGRPLSFNIWVDAICIDQSADGEQEKLAQIPLMREIYAKAQRVYIWLGLETESSIYAMDWISEASLGMSPFLGVKFRSFPANMIFPSELAKLVRMAPELIKGIYHRWNPKPPTMEYDSQHTQDIFLRPWFTRMWTVQELVMASEPIVVCGSKSMRWDSFFWGMVKALELEQKSGVTSSSGPFNSLIRVTGFWYDLYRKEEFSQPIIRTWANKISQPLLAISATRLLDFLEDYSRRAIYIQSSLIMAVMLGQVLRGLRPLNTIWLIPPIFSMLATLFFRPAPRSNAWMENFHGQLIYILNTTRHRQASQPQDKVYALYGVLASLDFNLQPLTEKTHFEEVYLDFTKRVINWHKSLDILLEAGIPPAAGEARLQSTPSWVPDWRWPLDRISWRKCKATKDSSPAYSFSESGLEIITKGIVVDVLDSVASVPGNLQDPVDHEASRADLLALDLRDSIIALRVWIQRVNRLHQPMVRGPPEDVIFEVLHSNAQSDVYYSDELRVTFHRWYALVLADYPILDETSPASWKIASNVAHDKVLYRYYRRLLKWTAGRKLFTTTQGYIGTGPTRIEKGDAVVLIAGFGLPMIVRANAEKKYTVIGAAHIHKMVDGDAWPDDEEELEEIVLG